jgi:predicted amino acid-binding ACT domain protein
MKRDIAFLRALMNDPSHQMRKNYPRNIALLRPAGNKVIEFMIISKNEIGVLASISGVFARQNINIEVTYGHADRQGNAYLLILYADFSNSPCTVDQIVKDLKDLPVTHMVEVDIDQKRHFDDFLYPIVSVDGERAVIMGLNALIKLEQTMFEKIGSGGHAFLYQMGKDYSIENSKILKSSNFPQDRESQLKNLADSLKAAGWGIFDMRKIWNGFDIVISQPYLLDGHTFVDTRFIYGMLAGSLQSIFEEEFFVLETRYDTRENSILLKLRTKTKDNHGHNGEL